MYTVSPISKESTGVHVWFRARSSTHENSRIQATGHPGGYVFLVVKWHVFWVWEVRLHLRFAACVLLFLRPLVEVFIEYHLLQRLSLVSRIITRGGKVVLSQASVSPRTRGRFWVGGILVAIFLSGLGRDARISSGTRCESYIITRHRPCTIPPYLG